MGTILTLLSVEAKSSGSSQDFWQYFYTYQIHITYILNDLYVSINSSSVFGFELDTEGVMNSYSKEALYAINNAVCS